MKSLSLWIVVVTAAIALMCTPGSASAQGLRLSAEGFGGFAAYTDSCCSGTGYMGGGAVNLGTPLEDGLSVGGRLQIHYLKTDVNVLGLPGVAKTLNIAIGPQVEFGNPEILTANAYVVVGYSGVDRTIFGTGGTGKGLLIGLGGGGRLYLVENFFLLGGLDLSVGYGNAESVNFTLHGGAGLAFE